MQASLNQPSSEYHIVGISRHSSKKNHTNMSSSVVMVGAMNIGESFQDYS